MDEETLSVMKELIKQRDDAIRERDACHKCWDDFTATVCSVLPELKNAPLFQQADSIVFVATNRDMLAASLLGMQEERDHLQRLLNAHTKTQTCAHCGQVKPTPYRRDDLGGYVCLTCVERYLDDALDALDVAGVVDWRK
jgi:hypothetical protein